MTFSPQGTGPLRFLQESNAELHDENQQLREELYNLRQVINALRDLQDISNSVNTDTDVIELMESILAVALLSVDAESGSLALLDEQAGELVFVVVHGAVSEALLNYRMSASEGLGGWVASHNQPVYLENARDDPRFSAIVDENFDYRTQSMLAVPVTYGNRVLGVIYALNKIAADQFDNDDQSLLMVVAQLAANAMVKAEGNNGE